MPGEAVKPDPKAGFGDGGDRAVDAATAAEDVVAAVFELAAHPDAHEGSVFKIASDGS
jgi:hypothetical protein